MSDLSHVHEAARPHVGEPSDVVAITGGWVVDGPDGRVAVHDVDMFVIPVDPVVSHHMVSVGLGARGAVLAGNWR